MPLEAFEHLNEQKKQTLLDAAVREFSDNPYERASIFNIAKSAGISRSGFYYYFADKEDIYSFLLDRICTELESMLVGEISVLDLPEKVFDHFAQFKGTEKQNLIFRVLENMKPSVQSFFASNMAKTQMIKNRLQIADMDKLKAETENDIRLFGFMTANCIVLALKAYYETDIPLDIIRGRLNRGLGYIKYGIVKEESR
ncbi:MAG: TetR/AcrR family transcriptional regulator [Oscillospiraceae bacterium]